MALLDVADLRFRYDREILKGLSFAIERGDFVSLFGVNGAGKSTLLKNLNGLLKYTHGSVYLDGRNMREYIVGELARQVAYVNQHNIAIKNKVYDMILIGRLPYIRGGVTDLDHEIVSDIIHKLELDDIAFQDADTLSGGQFQKVVLARALAQEPKVLLLDEPTSNLDIKNQVNVMELVRRYCLEKNIAVFLSIHDINLALKFSNKYLMLLDGTVYAYGGADVITTRSIRDVYHIDVEIIEHKNKKFVVL